LPTTTRVNIEFVSPLSFRISNHCGVSITIAALEEKEKEKVKNSVTCSHSNDAIVQIAFEISISSHLKDKRENVT